MSAAARWAAALLFTAGVVAAGVGFFFADRGGRLSAYARATDANGNTVGTLQAPAACPRAWHLPAGTGSSRAKPTMAQLLDHLNPEAQRWLLELCPGGRREVSREQLRQHWVLSWHQRGPRVRRESASGSVTSVLVAIEPLP